MQGLRKDKSPANNTPEIVNSGKGASYVTTYSKNHIRCAMSISSMLRAIAFVLITPPTAAWADVVLVMVEEAGCLYCAQWNEEVGIAYPLTPEGEAAPLRRVDIGALPDELPFDSRPVFTPTFVLFVDGSEVGRLEGYPGEDFFWPLLGRALDAHVPGWREEN